MHEKVRDPYMLYIYECAQITGLGGSASVGLALTYAYAVTGNLSAMIGAVTETEKESVAVERVVQYLELPSEVEPRESNGITVSIEVFTDLKHRVLNPSTVQLPLQWPSAGKLEFRDVTLRYLPHLPNVLSNISFIHAPGSFTAIIGRTGSGVRKSVELFKLCVSHIYSLYFYKYASSTYMILLNQEKAVWLRRFYKLVEPMAVVADQFWLTTSLWNACLILVMCGLVSQ